VKLGDRVERSIVARAFTPNDFEEQAEPYLIEIPPRKKLSSHFFLHKGQEIGYLVSGKLHVIVDNVTYKLRSGDLVYLTSEIPSQWKNPGSSVAKLLWIKLK
jgi:quercetin dioxygenase-like cupin family protein